MASIIVAHDENGVIGNNGSLPWHLPEDLRLFKKRTVGQVVVMGRKTWESIPEKFRPLPERVNIVISRSPGHTVSSVEEAFSYANEFHGDKEVFVIGGGQIYDYVINNNLVDRIFVTLVKGSFEGDTCFPNLNDRWKEVNRVEYKDFFVIEKLFY